MINSSSFHFSEEQTIISTEILKKKFLNSLKEMFFVVFDEFLEWRDGHDKRQWDL